MITIFAEVDAICQRCRMRSALFAVCFLATAFASASATPEDIFNSAKYPTVDDEVLDEQGQPR